MSSDLLSLPPDLRQRLTSELQPGERVLYAGRPDWRAEWFKLLLIFLFGVGWSAITFTFAFITGAATLGLVPFKFEGQPASPWLAGAFLLFLIPFLAVGVACLSAPVLGIAKTLRTVHAVTNRRIISVFGGFSRGVQSHPLSAINFVKRKDRKNGTGSLEIAYGITHDADGDPRPLTTDWSGIPDVRRAEAALQAQ